MFSICQQVGFPAHARLQGIENGARQIFHVNKRQQLPSISDAKIKAASNAFDHQEIIAFARTIDTCRAKCHVRKFRKRLQVAFCRQFGTPVGCDGGCRAGCRERAIARLVATTKHAHAAHHQKSVGNGSDVQ